MAAAFLLIAFANPIRRRFFVCARLGHGCFINPCRHTPAVDALLAVFSVGCNAHF